MTLRVSGKNIDIGEALRQHVIEKSIRSQPNILMERSQAM